MPCPFDKKLSTVTLVNKVVCLKRRPKTPSEVQKEVKDEKGKIIARNVRKEHHSYYLPIPAAVAAALGINESTIVQYEFAVPSYQLQQVHGAEKGKIGEGSALQSDN